MKPIAMWGTALKNGMLELEPFSADERGAVVLQVSSTLRTEVAAKQLKPSALFQTQGCNLLTQYTWQSSLVEYEPAFATTAHTPFLASLQLTGLYLFIYLFIILLLEHLTK